MIEPSDTDRVLGALRPALLRFAQIQLRDADLAEDAVQEAMLAALSQKAGFRGAASVDTWVFAILKNKIVDVLRVRMKTTPVSAYLEEGETLEEGLENLFKKNGHWSPSGRPAIWQCPEKSFENKQFWGFFEACLIHLPENTARVFMMREFLELETTEICDSVGINTSHCHVILHRARHTLRRCLESSWFKGGLHGQL